jgi:hypothetical protein
MNTYFLCDSQVGSLLKVEMAQGGVDLINLHFACNFIRKLQALHLFCQWQCVRYLQKLGLVTLLKMPVTNPYSSPTTLGCDASVVVGECVFQSRWKYICFQNSLGY